MSAAQELHTAAQRLRTLAEAATPGPWEAVGNGVNLSPPGTWISGWLIPVSKPANAEFIAAMHPGAALALADWLDDEAREWEGIPKANPRYPSNALARLINGSAS